MNDEYKLDIRNISDLKRENMEYRYLGQNDSRQIDTDNKGHSEYF